VTHIGALGVDGVVENVPQHVDGRFGFDCNAGLHSQLVNEADEFFGGGGGGRGARGRVGGCRRDGGFVVEAVEVASCFLEVAHPAFWLDRPSRQR
jgi:hypothetical protein